MKIQICTLTDNDEETGRKFDIPDLSWYIAETENEARLLVMDETGYNGYRVISWGEVEVTPISKCARYVYGGD